MPQRTGAGWLGASSDGQGNALVFSAVFADFDLHRHGEAVANFQAVKFGVDAGKAAVHVLLAVHGADHRLALQGVLTSRLALGGGPASEIGVSPAFAYLASTTRGCCYPHHCR